MVTTKGALSVERREAIIKRNRAIPADVLAREMLEQDTALREECSDLNEIKLCLDRHAIRSETTRRSCREFYVRQSAQFGREKALELTLRMIASLYLDEEGGEE